MRANFQILLAVWLLVLAQACTDADDDVQVPVDTGASNVLVLNEGLFRRGNANISGYDAEASISLGTVYDPSNSAAGGLDILQSATELGDTLVLVANNSNSLVLLETETLEEIDRFEALGSPRYLTRMGNGQLLVTDLFAGRLLELNPDFTQARIIPQEGQAEGSVAFEDGALFASPSRNIVFYYDAILGEVTDSLAVPFRANGLVVLDAGRIGVCGGILNSGESGGLAIVDWNSKTIDFSISFSESESSLYPRIAVHQNQLFCLQRDLVIVPLDDLDLTSVSRIILENFVDPYGLGIDPINGEFYISDAKSGLNFGEVIRLSPAGVPIDSFDVGIFPNGFIFR
jgi:hypothetical protein